MRVTKMKRKSIPSSDARLARIIDRHLRLGHHFRRDPDPAPDLRQEQHLRRRAEMSRKGRAPRRRATYLAYLGDFSTSLAPKGRQTKNRVPGPSCRAPRAPTSARTSPPRPWAPTRGTTAFRRRGVRLWPKIKRAKGRAHLPRKLSSREHRGARQPRSAGGAAAKHREARHWSFLEQGF